MKYIGIHRLLSALLFSACMINAHAQESKTLIVNDSSYFEKRGLNVFVFDNRYGLFGDEKASGIEIIHHGVRTATNGDVRLNPTPMQWDSIPQFVKRNVNKDGNSIETFLKYPAFNFSYSIRVTSMNDGIAISVNLTEKLPSSLEGKAGLNLEFLPAAYFGKSYLADNNSGIFPLYPSGSMVADAVRTDPKPLTTGSKLILAPEDAERRISIDGNGTKVALFDGRNQAQNGWFVVRSLLPAGKTGQVLQWFIKGNTIAGWVRQPVIAHSQVGYHPDQKKIAVIELDKNDSALPLAKLFKVNSDGSFSEKLNKSLTRWGNYLRFNYFSFDFTDVKEPGVYIIGYGKLRTKPFRIATDIYDNAWHPTLDIYFPVQMDHMFVNEAYRVWHGRSHMDDALQAPVNHEHFDLYAQGPETGNKFKPGEHIPGLNIGGWYDAGDFDIRTQTQYGTVIDLVKTWDIFKPTRDETLIDQKIKTVDMHHPDGVPDIIQQIEHGTLQLLAQHQAVGYAINGIVEAHLDQYTHLGDGSTKTDNLVFNPKLKENESDGLSTGNFDDRWAFTSRSSALNYGSAAGLAAAARALKGFNDTLATKCIRMATKVWEEENSHLPDLFRHGNTTGGALADEKLKAALELLITTGEIKYADTIRASLPVFRKQFGRYAVLAVQAIPYLDAAYKNEIERLLIDYKSLLSNYAKINPYGVPIGTGGWAGSGQVIGFAVTNYYLHKAFPAIIDKEMVFRGLNFIYGCHPGSDISFVSAVGTDSKKVAYGNNRADFSFIAGGVVPGVLILKPDFPENKEDWPFLWGENEYVVNLGASYIFLVHAVNDLLQEVNH